MRRMVVYGRDECVYSSGLIHLQSDFSYISGLSLTLILTLTLNLNGFLTLTHISNSST